MLFRSEPAGAAGQMQFNSVAEAEAAKLPKGTKVLIFSNGTYRPATIQ